MCVSGISKSRESKSEVSRDEEREQETVANEYGEMLKLDVGLFAHIS